MANKENANVVVNVENSAKTTSRVFEYTRTDNGKKSLALVLSIRFKKEAKGTKPEDSHGFAKFTDAARKAAKKYGVKAYFTRYITEYKRDNKGDFVRDSYGDRVKEMSGGWLFETAGGEFDKVACQKAIEAAKQILVDGLKNGDFILEEKKAKSPAKKKVTKSDLEAQNALLASKLAEAMAVIENLKKAVNK